MNRCPTFHRLFVYDSAGFMHVIDKSIKARIYMISILSSKFPLLTCISKQARNSGTSFEWGTRELCEKSIVWTDQWISESMSQRVSQVSQ